MLPHKVRERERNFRKGRFSHRAVVPPLPCPLRFWHSTGPSAAMTTPQQMLEGLVASGQMTLAKAQELLARFARRGSKTKKRCGPSAAAALPALHARPALARSRAARVSDGSPASATGPRVGRGGFRRGSGPSRPFAVTSTASALVCADRLAFASFRSNQQQRAAEALEDDGEEHDVDLGAVGAAAAGDVDDGADHDGSGTYQIYLPKLVKARCVHRISSRLRRLLGREPVVRRCFSWAGNLEALFRVDTAYARRRARRTRTPWWRRSRWLRCVACFRQPRLIWSHLPPCASAGACSACWP